MMRKYEKVRSICSCEVHQVIFYAKEQKSIVRTVDDMGMGIWYCGLHKVCVVPGQHLEKGDLIGKQRIKEEY